MRVTSKMIYQGMKDIENNPYFKSKNKHKVEDGTEDKKTDGKESVKIADDVIVEKDKEKVTVVKLDENGKRQIIKEASLNSKLGQQMARIVDNDDNKAKDLEEKIKDITLNSKRLSLANYL